MKKTLFAFLALLSLAWAGNLPYGSGLPEGGQLWLIRAEVLNLTGLWSIGLMSLIMVLATRPAWLETPLGGMDKMYRLHKWAGILAVSFAALHWLVEMSDDIIKALVGRAGKISREHGSAFFEMMRDLGKDLGEWAIYALLAMLVLTLWQRFPFKPWRTLHRVMPVLYLMLVIHAIFLAPLAYWSQPAGMMLGLLLAAGSWGSLQSLLGRIGHSRQVAGKIIAAGNPAPDLTEVVCQLEPGWRGHRAGQFIFLTLDNKEGAHPFTIASADQGNQRLSFQIKALGDYTHNLASRLQVGQAVMVEGPYGRFDFRHHKGKPQVWIAGGVGITPFLAGLEALGQHPDSGENTSVEVYYCTRDSHLDPFIPRLQQLCATRPQVRLHIRDTSQAGTLTAANLIAQQPELANAEIWFCGPNGFAHALRQDLQASGLGQIPFHQEVFEMR